MNVATTGWYKNKAKYTDALRLLAAQHFRDRGLDTIGVQVPCLLAFLRTLIRLSRTQTRHYPTWIGQGPWTYAAFAFSIFRQTVDCSYCTSPARMTGNSREFGTSSTMATPRCHLEGSFSPPCNV